MVDLKELEVGVGILLLELPLPPHATRPSAAAPTIVSSVASLRMLVPDVG
jgi:hypothetical protein